MNKKKQSKMKKLKVFNNLEIVGNDPKIMPIIFNVLDEEK